MSGNDAKTIHPQRLLPTSYSCTKSFLDHVRRLSQRLLPYKSSKRIALFIYDLSVIAHYRLQGKSKTAQRKVELSNKDVSRIIDTISWFYDQDIVTEATPQLLAFFGSNVPDFARACTYFDSEIMGRHPFASDWTIIVDESSKKLICKDDAQHHTLSEPYYQPIRGKRLPWIIDTIKRSRHCYNIDPSPSGEDQLMLVSHYRYPLREDGTTNYRCEYFALILRRLGASVKMYRLVTAFGVDKYNQMLAKMSRATKWIGTVTP